MKEEIRHVTLAEVLTLKVPAQTMGAFIEIKPDLNYIGCFIDGRLVGFCGFVAEKDGALFASDFVLHEFRRRGIYRRMDMVRREFVRAGGAKWYRIVCTQDSIPTHAKGGVITRRWKKCIQFTNPL